MTEPDWSNVDAVRAWLGSRYPNSNNQTGSPLYQYLKDELRKGHKLKGRETHLSNGDGGEFLKWVFENSGDKAVYYPRMRVTYFPEFVDPPTPDTDEDDHPKPESSTKLARPQKRSQRKKGANTSVSTPHQKTPRRGKLPKADTGVLQVQEERLRTLRPRHNGKVYKMT